MVTSSETLFISFKVKKSSKYEEFWLNTYLRNVFSAWVFNRGIELAGLLPVGLIPEVVVGFATAAKIVKGKICSGQ